MLVSRCPAIRSVHPRRPAVYLHAAQSSANGSNALMRRCTHAPVPSLQTSLQRLWRIPTMLPVVPHAPATGAPRSSLCRITPIALAISPPHTRTPAALLPPPPSTCRLLRAHALRAHASPSELMPRLRPHPQPPPRRPHPRPPPSPPPSPQPFRGPWHRHRPLRRYASRAGQ